jgi:hypothetical protein
MQTIFLATAGAIGLTIGAVATFRPKLVLVGKGVRPDDAPAIWVREVGVLIMALSLLLVLVRSEPASPAVRAILWSNALAHVGLFPIELVAWHRGAIPRLGGIVANSVLHVGFALTFVFFAITQ